MSSFLIKAGYNGWHKQIVNINLLKNDFWSEGMVTIYSNDIKLNFNNNMKLKPHVNNKLEMIEYNNKYALMFNNMIVYDSHKLFTYDINLFFDSTSNNYTSNNIYSYIKYDTIDLPNMISFNNLRTLN